MSHTMPSSNSPGLELPLSYCTNVHPCREAADVDCSGTVDGTDLGKLLAQWGPGHGTGDLDGSGTVDGTDLGRLLGAWGPVQ